MFGCAGSDNNFSTANLASGARAPTSTNAPDSGVTPNPEPALPTTISPVALIPRPSNSPNMKVCGASQSVAGIDVSNYDPNTNWNLVTKAQAKFSFIKATEGMTLTNRFFASDWRESKVAGVIRGAYHFYHPKDDAVTQADFYLATIGQLENTDLPAMFDWEATDGVSRTQQIETAVKWLAYVEEKTGKTPIIYTDTSFWNELGNPQGFERYPLFIANYDIDCPEIPPPWNTWTFWQKGIGPFPGVQASGTDFDLFNGSLRELTRLF